MQHGGRSMRKRQQQFSLCEPAALISSRPWSAVLTHSVVGLSTRSHDTVPARSFRQYDGFCGFQCRSSCESSPAAVVLGSLYGAYIQHRPGSILLPYIRPGPLMLIVGPTQTYVSWAASILGAIAPSTTCAFGCPCARVAGSGRRRALCGWCLLEHSRGGGRVAQRHGLFELAMMLSLSNVSDSHSASARLFFVVDLFLVTPCL
ncbi:hypothetical protein B0H11DRAFT_22153 [Mycena galericulata]|nr:hypothetical protein B0H11DRAFT_22153 [Mycena galericulata]